VERVLCVCDFHKKWESLEQRMAQSQLYAGILPEVSVSILLLLNFIILKCLTFYFLYFFVRVLI
jgi:hypothetical protein